MPLPTPNEKTKKFFIEAKELLIIALSIIPTAIVINKILVPHAIIGGGVAGLCEIIYFATNTKMPIWLSTIIINAILLSFAFKLINGKFCIRTIYGVFCLTLWLKIIPIATTPLISDPFMAVILGGLFNGVGLGIVFLNNGTTGGVDIVATLINKFSNYSVGRAMLVCDFIVISSAWLLPQVTKIEQLLFGLCYTFMATLTIDWVMNRTKQSVQFLIFSQQYEKIAQAIMTQAHRGVTILNGTGGYTHTPVNVIVVIVRKYEANSIIRLIRSIDPKAFISESPTESVLGKGFEPIAKNNQKNTTNQQ